MSFNSSQFIDDRNTVVCRHCDLGTSNPPSRAWRCYLGETTWPTTGERRAVVVFVCIECGAHRYLDLSTAMPEAERAALHAGDYSSLDLGRCGSRYDHTIGWVQVVCSLPRNHRGSHQGRSQGVGAVWPNKGEGGVQSLEVISPRPDDIEVPGVQRLEFSAEAGKANRCRLELFVGSVELEGDADVVMVMRDQRPTLKVKP
jgi:hypothetical protein